MADKFPEMKLKAIGVVRNEFKKGVAVGYPSWHEVVSEIVIDSSLTEALDGLDDFSHIVVLYWMHQVDEDEMPLKVHPMRRRESALVGIFGTRTPNRPNRIGKATVRLLRRQGNVLTVQGLDALNGSPVIDIKPYIPGYDSADNATVPSWLTS
jgi:tRNA-Thr(GGU) m(6)t(6)A37 methyltransferase TsaA